MVEKNGLQNIVEPPATSEILRSVSGCGTKSRSVLSESSLVIITSACLSDCGHAIDFKLGAKAAVAVDLADGAGHRLFELLERGAAEAVASENLCLFLGLRDICIRKILLPLG